MTDTDQNKEDDVLRRMLATKPKPRKVSGKRSEVEDAHDRYANIEVSYLKTSEHKPQPRKANSPSTLRGRPKSKPDHGPVS